MAEDSLKVIDPKQFKHIIKNLAGNPGWNNIYCVSLEDLFVYPFKVDPSEPPITTPFVDLANALESNTTITHVGIGSGGSRISSKGLGRFLTVLSDRPKFKYFYVHTTKFSDKLKQIRYSHLLIGNNTLERFIVLDPTFSDKDVIELSHGIVHNNTLQYIDLHDTPRITHQGLQALFKVLAINRSISCINIGACNISFESIAILSDALRENYTLSRLFLNNCKISDESLICLGKGIRINNGLQELELQQNCITDHGIRGFLSEIKHNTTLCTLKIGQNENTTGKSFQYFAEYFSQNPPLTTLTFGFHSFCYDFSSNDLMCLSKSLESNTNLVSLDIGNTAYTRSDIEIFFDNLFYKNYTLTHIWMIPYRLNSEHSDVCEIYIKLSTNMESRNRANRNMRNQTLLDLLLPIVAYSSSTSSNNSNNKKHLL